MSTASPTRPTGEDPPTQVAQAVTARVVTAEQVNRAVLQLRERPGQTAVEQIQAVLRALDLTVDREPVIPEQRH